MQSKTYELLIESREEYTRQYVSLTRALYIQGFESIWETMRAKKRQVRFYLCDFQRMLSKIPEWSQLIIDQEADRFVQTTRCDWLEDLVKAIYVVNVKILSYVATRRGVSKDRLKVEVPTLGTFIHRSYITMARALWKKPMLMFSTSEVDRLANREELERLVEEGVRETVRESLPFKDILGHLFQGGDASATESSAAVSESEGGESVRGYGRGRRRHRPSATSSVVSSPRASSVASSSSASSVHSEAESDTRMDDDLAASVKQALSDTESEDDMSEDETVESHHEEEPLSAPVPAPAGFDVTTTSLALDATGTPLGLDATLALGARQAQSVIDDADDTMDSSASLEPAAADINIHDITSPAVPLASAPAFEVPVATSASGVPVASSASGVPVASSASGVPVTSSTSEVVVASTVDVAPVEESLSVASRLEPFISVETPLRGIRVETQDTFSNTVQSEPTVDPSVKTVIYDPPAARPRSRLHGADKVRSILGVHMSPREVVENKDHLRRTLLRRFAEL